MCCTNVLSIRAYVDINRPPVYGTILWYPSNKHKPCNGATTVRGAVTEPTSLNALAVKAVACQRLTQIFN